MLSASDGDASWEGSLRPSAAQPPAAIVLTYKDQDVVGLDEAGLRLGKKTASGWEVAGACYGSHLIRLPEQNMLVAPICECGTYVLITPVNYSHSIRMSLLLKQ